jgi:hypothetical protein
MPIRMTKPSEGSSFSIAIEDRFDMSDDHIVELMSMDEYNGISKIDGKPFTSIIWHCRIYDADGVAFTNEIDHAPYDFAEFSSLSLAKGSKGPSKARIWASAFIGHDLSEEECEAIAENFDGALVGKRALASWMLEDDKTNGGKKLKFALLRPIPPRMKQAAAAKAAPKAAAPTNGSVAGASKTVTVPTPLRETAAERRARLIAELDAMEETADEDAAPAGNDADGDLPF